MQRDNADDSSRSFGTGLALVIFLSFASAYFLSYALRTVNATLAPYLVSDLALSPADLGWLSSAYFISFAVLQWPLGFWLDRYGARRVNASLLLIAALGCLLMAAGDTLSSVSLGRILVGAGVSACLMAPFSYFRRCYPPERQAQLGLWLLVAGTSGAVMSTLPAGALAATIGWRTVFTLFGLLVLAAALAIFFLVPDDDLKRAQTDDGPESSSGGLMRHPAVIRVVPVAIFSQGGMVALQTLWIGPWMTRMLGMDNAGMASTLFTFMLALMCFYIAMSFLSPVLQRRGLSLQRIAITGHLMTIPLLPAIALLPVPGAWLLWLGIAMALPAMSLLQPAFSLDFPKAMAGRVLTLFNLFVFTGSFSVQWGIGLLIDFFQHLEMSEHHAYQTAFLCLSGLQILAWMWFWLYGRRRRFPAAPAI